jgi:hypothetical protein
MSAHSSPIYLPDSCKTPADRYKPKLVLAVDPGDMYVGTALWRASDQSIRAKEYAADEWLPIFAKLVKKVDVVVVEKFALYPGKAAAQSWSPMATSEMIGAMKWITKQAGCLLQLQGADIKTPTRRQCKARWLVYKNKSIHAADALLHLHYFLLRHELEE